MNQTSQSNQQQVQAGTFPFVNTVHLVGQVWPTQYEPQGLKWQDGQAGKDGTMTVNVKVRKSWGGQTPGVKQAIFKVKVYGAAGHALGQQIFAAFSQAGPGRSPMVELQGELVIKNYQAKQGKSAGQWKTDASVTVSPQGSKTGPLPFNIIGVLPVLDEGQKTQGFGQGGGFGAPQQQAWGQPQQQQGFAQAAPAQGGFGQPAPQQQAWGQQAAVPQGGFGVPAQTAPAQGGFGQPAVQQNFAPQGGFGQPAAHAAPQAQAGQYSQPAPAFGQQATQQSFAPAQGGFGQPAANAAAPFGGGFGGGFGAPTTMAAAGTPQAQTGVVGNFQPGQQMPSSFPG